MTFAPSDVGGLVTWLRASDLSLSNGAAVTNWPDASGNSLPAIQIPSSVTPAASSPTFATNVTTTGGPAVRFVGDDVWSHTQQLLYFGVNTPMTSLTAGELIIYFKNVSGTVINQIHAQNGPGYVSGYTVGDIYDDAFTTTGHSATPPSWDGGASWTTYGVAGSPTYWAMFLNGTRYAYTTTNIVTARDIQTVGGYTYNGGAGAYGMNGWIAEYMVFDHVLTNVDRTLIRDYLLERHEGTTPPDHPTAAIEVAANPGIGIAQALTSQIKDAFTGPDIKSFWTTLFDGEDPDHPPTLAIVDDHVQWNFDASYGRQSADIYIDPDVLALTFDEVYFQGYLDNFDPTINTELFANVYGHAIEGTYPYYGAYFDIYHGDLNYNWYWYDGVDYLSGGDAISPYDPVAHSWLKMVQDEDLYIRFYTSADNITWTEVYASPDPTPQFVNCNLDLWCYHDADGGRMEDFTWIDNLNATVDSGGALPDELDFDTPAPITITAGQYPDIIINPPTAHLVLAVDPATLTIIDNSIQLVAVTAEVSLQVAPFTILPSTYIAGDPFGAPAIISGSTGTFVADITYTTTEPGEPDLAFSTRTYWARYTPPYNGILTLTSPTTGGSFVIDAFAGASLDALTNIGSVTYPGGDPLDISVATGQPVHIRVRNLGAGFTPNEYYATAPLAGTGTLSLSVLATPQRAVGLSGTGALTAVSP